MYRLVNTMIWSNGWLCLVLTTVPVITFFISMISNHKWSRSIGGVTYLEIYLRCLYDYCTERIQVKC